MLLDRLGQPAEEQPGDPLPQPDRASHQPPLTGQVAPIGAGQPVHRRARHRFRLRRRHTQTAQESQQRGQRPS